MLKKLFTQLLIASLFFSLQIQAAHAVAPLVLVPIASEIVVDAIGGEAIYTAGTGMVTTIGAIVSGIVFPSSTTTAPYSAPVIVETNPKRPMAVPAGWTAPTSAQQAAGDYKPNPPALLTATNGFIVLNPPNSFTCAGQPSVAALSPCASSFFTGAYGAVQTLCTVISTTIIRCSSQIVNPNTSYIVNDVVITAQYYCPAGYTVSGTQCVSPNKLLVKKPDLGAAGTCEIVRVGNGYAPDLLNPACIAGSLPMLRAANGGKVDVVAGTATLTYPDGTSAAFIINTTDGTSKLVRTQPDAATNTTTVTTTNLTAPNVTTGATTVTGVATQVMNGTGTAASPTPSAPVTLNLPTDYARQGEVATAVAPLSTKLDTLHNDLKSDLVPADATASAISALVNAQASKDAVPNDIQSIPNSSPVTPPSLFQPFTPAACTPLSWTFNSSVAGTHTATFDLCSKVGIIRDVGGWSLYLLTASLLFSMFTRRPDGASV